MENAKVGEVALVTGGASGIGRARTLAFARAGAKVVVGDIDVEAGEATIEQIRAARGTAMFVRCDVASLDEVEALVASGVES